MLASTAAANANVISYLYLFRIAAVLFAANIPLLFLLPDPRKVRHCRPATSRSRWSTSSHRLRSRRRRLRNRNEPVLEHDLANLREIRRTAAAHDVGDFAEEGLAD